MHKKRQTPCPRLRSRACERVCAPARRRCARRRARWRAQAPRACACRRSARWAAGPPRRSTPPTPGCPPPAPALAAGRVVAQTHQPHRSLLSSAAPKKRGLCAPGTVGSCLVLTLNACQDSNTAAGLLHALEAHTLARCACMLTLACCRLLPLHEAREAHARMRRAGRRVCSYSRKPTFSPTVSESNSAPFWNTMPTLRRAASAASSDSRPLRGVPSIRTSPWRAQPERQAPGPAAPLPDTEKPAQPCQVYVWCGSTVFPLQPLSAPGRGRAGPP